MTLWAITREAVGRLVLMTAAVAVLAACDAVQRKRSNSAVWDHYDIRQPLPHDSQIPDSQAQTMRENDPYRQYPQYIDNDSYYTMPVIKCGIGDLPACGE